jgi:hypothetical protein
METEIFLIYRLGADGDFLGVVEAREDQATAQNEADKMNNDPFDYDTYIVGSTTLKK